MELSLHEVEKLAHETLSLRCLLNVQVNMLSGSWLYGSGGREGDLRWHYKRGSYLFTEAL